MWSRSEESMKQRKEQAQERHGEEVLTDAEMECGWCGYGDLIRRHYGEGPPSIECLKCGHKMRSPA